LILEEDWLGGEIFHKQFAARARMIQYAVETEEKILCLPEERGPVILALFSNGFDWRKDHLEDFPYSYRYGRPFDGDHFGLMQAHFVETESIEFRGTIDHFAFFRRGSSSLRPTGGSWSVRPVHFSPERGFF
jgi:hypothetical protein